MPLISCTASSQDLWYVPADNPHGVTIQAAYNGMYRLTVMNGAYCTDPWSVIDTPEWRTLWVIYKNRSLEYGSPEYYTDNNGAMADKRLINWDYSLGDDNVYSTFEQAALASEGTYVDIPLKKGEFIVIVANEKVNVEGAPYGANMWYDYNSGGLNLKVELLSTGPTLIRPADGPVLSVNYPPPVEVPFERYENVYIDAQDESGVTIRADETGYYYLYVNDGGYRTLNQTTCPPDSPDWLGWKNAIAVFKNRPIEYNETGVTNWDYLIGSPDNQSSYEQVNELLSTVKSNFKPGLSVALKKNDTLTFVCLDSQGGYNDNSGGMTFKAQLLSPIYSIPEKIGIPVASVITGTGISILGIFWSKLISFIDGGIKSYLQRVSSLKEIKLLGITARTVKKPIILQLSFLELVVAIITSLLLGVVFLYADKLPFLLENIGLYILVAGVATIVHELAHMRYAWRYSANTELRFWGIGTLAMAVTTLMFGMVFGQPSRTIINEQDKLGKSKSAIISLAGPAASLGLSFVFLALIFFGNSYSYIGIKGLPISLVTCVYSLLPFEPMEGKRVFNWDWALWIIIFFPLLFAYLAMLVVYAIYVL